MSFGKRAFHHRYGIVIYYNRLFLTFILGVILLHLASVFSFPPVFSSSPTVVINEIAWMGTSASSSAEWIEIFNPSEEEIDVDGWILRSRADTESAGTYTPKIVLSGSIQAKGCCLFERTSDNTLLDVSADYIYTGALNDSGEKMELLDEEGNIVDLVGASGGWFAGDKSSRRSMERKESSVSGSDSNNWQTSLISPGTPMSVGCNTSTGSRAVEKTAEDEQPAVDFSFPKSVSAGAEFSVTVNLSNFEPGTYALKVLVGRGGNFIYGNTKGQNGWLSQNGAWKEMPQLTIGSSLQGSQTVQAKVDEDAPPGSYVIAVSIAKKDSDRYKTLWATKDLATKLLNVIEAVVESEDKGEVTEVEGTEELQIGLEDVGGGEVLGEANQEGKKKFALNFYLVTGIFGLLMGGAGLFFGFRYLP